MEQRLVLATFTVNTTVDTVDVFPGDGLAVDAAGKTSLRAAVMEANALNGDDFIQLPAGAYVLSLTGDGNESTDNPVDSSGDLDVTDATGGLTIQGAGAELSFINAGGSEGINDRVFDVAAEDVSLNLYRVTVTGGRAEDGGGVRNIRGVLSVDSCRIVGNIATRSGGGGISNQRGTVAVGNSLVSSNSSTQSPQGSSNAGGGGIDNHEGQLTIDVSRIFNNTADDFGGGIANSGEQATVRVDNSVIEMNAGSEGGGVYNSGGTATVNYTDILQNTSRSRGGAAANLDGTLTIESSRITENTSYSGGGIYNKFGSVAVTTSDVSSNSAMGDDGYGGAIYNLQGKVAIDDSRIIGNAARDSGGALHTAGGEVKVENSTFRHNVSEKYGGAIWSNGDSTLTITDTTIEENTASSGGGGLAAFDGRALIIGCTLNGNTTAGLGGAILLGQSDSLAVFEMTNSTVSANQSEGSGGGAFLQTPTSTGTGSTNVSVRYNTITQNRANGLGGGVTHAGGGSVSSVGTIVASNTASSGDNDVSGNFESLGHNLIGDVGSATGFTHAADHVGGANSLALDPGLGPLQDNGGPTRTHSLLVGSAAIDGGSTASAPCRDQRGIIRPEDGDADGSAVPDIGAFELRPTEVYGFKYEDNDGNGTFDPDDDQPLSGWTVFLDGYDGTPPNGVLDPSEPFEITDVDGFYRFAQLDAGTYVVTEEIQEGWIPRSPQQQSVEVNEGESSLVDFLNSVPCSIHGLKYEDVDGDGNYTPGTDELVPGVQFTLTGTDGLGNEVNQTATTDANGEFSFTGLMPSVQQVGAGTGYTITENVPRGHTPTTATSFTTDSHSREQLTALFGQAVIPPDDPRVEVVLGTPLIFGNVLTGSIHGMKYEDVDGDGNYTPGTDELLPGVQFTLTGTDGLGNLVNQTATTDANGEFNFTGLMPSVQHSGAGTGYTITEVATGYTPTTATSFTTDLLSGEELTAMSGQARIPPGDLRVEVVLGTALMFGNVVTGSIHGMMFEDVDGDGDYSPETDRPLAGAEFTLTGTDGLGNEVNLPPATTDVNGKFNFSGLMPSVRQAGAGTGYAITVDVPTGHVPTTSTSFTTDLHSGEEYVAFAGDAMLGPEDPRVEQPPDVALQFGRFELVDISGQKFNDWDGDGTRDAWEPGLAGWTIEIDMDGDGLADDSRLTDGQGNFTFTNIGPGVYAIGEDIRQNWMQTLPADAGKYFVTTRSGVDEVGLDFANLLAIPTSAIAPFVTTGDLDENGQIDLVVANDYADPRRFASNVTLVSNEGEGIFTSATLPLPDRARPKSAVYVELNEPSGAIAGYLAVATVGDPTAPSPDTNNVLVYLNERTDTDASSERSEANGVLVNIGDSHALSGPHVFGVGDGPIDIEAADLDSDSIVDLVTANFRSDSVSVLLGNGDGTFSTPAEIHVGRVPLAVCSDDLDGDGSLDLTVANYDSGTVSVLLGNGDGTFRAGRELTGLAGPTDILLHDLDEDGDIDLAVTNFQADQVAVFLGEGDGTFDMGRTFGVSAGPRSLALGQLIGDAGEDLVIANADAGTLSLLENLGNGDFAPAIEIDLPAIAGSAAPLAPSPWSIAVDDLDRNQTDDVAIAHFFGGVSIQFGNGSSSAVALSTPGEGQGDTYDREPASVAASTGDGVGTSVGGVAKGSFTAARRAESLAVSETASSPLHNSERPLDVNDDGVVSPHDALLIINELNGRPSAAESSSEREEDGDCFLDVDGNSVVTALDALLVVDWLNEGTNPSGLSLVPASLDAILPGTLDEIGEAAVEMWALAGLSVEVVERLSRVPLRVTDLPGPNLGVSDGGVIWLDINAAGHGWFVDPTPRVADEFVDAGGGILRAADDSTARHRVDLLTVILHEFAHLGDLQDDLPGEQEGLMSALLSDGIRRLPSQFDVDAFMADF